MALGEITSAQKPGQKTEVAFSGLILQQTPSKDGSITGAVPLPTQV